jgi:hypothetical protein
MTFKPDPRLCQHVPDERLHEVYASCVKWLTDWETVHGKESASHAPYYPRTWPAPPPLGLDVLELGQVLNELIAARTTLKMLSEEDEARAEEMLEEAEEKKKTKPKTRTR